MLDYLPMKTRSESLVLAQCLFLDHGRALIDAAARLAGASGEARVVSCAHRIMTARRMNHCIRQDLFALHRLLSLENVGGLECLETELFAGLDPTSPEVETICLLTDQLSDLLNQIDVVLALGADSNCEGHSVAA